MSSSVDTHEQPGAAELEVKRFRRAAEETLDQLELCVSLLYRIGKPRIAEVIASNHRSIRRQMGDAEG